MVLTPYLPLVGVFWIRLPSGSRREGGPDLAACLAHTAD